MSDNLASTILSEVHRFLMPLYDVAYAPDVVEDARRLLRGCGWVVTVELSPDDITDLIDPVVGAVEDLMADPVPDDLGDAIERLELITGVVDDLRNVGNDLAALGGAGPADANAAAALAEDLAHHLAIRWLETKSDVLKVTDLLDLTAWVDVTPETLAWLHRPAGRQRRIQLDGLPGILVDPKTFVFDRIAPDRWQSSDEVLATMLLIGPAISRLFGPQSWRLPLRSRASIPDPADVADQLRLPTLDWALPTTPFGGLGRLRFDLEGVGGDAQLPSGASGPGLSIVPRGDIDSTFDLGEWEYSAKGGLDTGGLALEVTPGGVSFDPSIDISLDVCLTRDLDLVLGVGRTGFTLGRLEVCVGGAAGIAAGGDAEIWINVVARDSNLGISTRDFGDAIAKVLPLDIQLPFDLGLEWSSSRGLTLAGSGSLEIELAKELSIAGGAFVVSNLGLELQLDDGAGPGRPSIGLAAIGDVSFDLNVLAATIEGIGLAADITFPPAGGNLGQAHLGLGLDLPESLGLQVQLEAVTGGGFLAIEHDIGRYSGALSLEIINVGISAITVIDTELPGDPDGFALFASLTITFPGLPLGFGFVLTGLGGIMAINRTLDAEALGLGLRNGVIDSLLFPDDPIGDAAQLIAQIDDYFPIQQGNAVFGPVLEVGWGAPTPLITAQVGVIISVPDGVIAVLGSISALLPTPAAPLITLNMDVLGVIDIPAGEMSIVASLYDSRLLASIDLSGDMAMYVRATDQPYFLLSVGGYHPSFSPPGHVPASMHDLRRMTASIHIASNVDVTIQSYFALTSNTVQFGASINVEASVEIWPTTYSARGWFEFNVLLQFSPFKLLADMSAGVGIYSGNKELLGVSLSVQLEGPKPWFVVGNATFKFFGVNVKFNLEVGSKAAGEPKPTIDLLDDVKEALESGASWTESSANAGLPSGIVFGAIEPADENDDTVWVRPDHRLSVTQGVAPLDRDIEVVGQGVPAPGHERLEITDAGFGALGSMETTTVEDWFAPAQYEDLSRTDKLTRASFELMPAGVSFGSEDVVGPAEVHTEEVTTDLQLETWVPDSDGADAMFRVSGMRATMRYDAPAAEPMFRLGSTSYTVASTVDGSQAFDDGVRGVVSGEELEAGVSQHVAIAAVRATLDDNPSRAAEFVIIPTTAALTTTAATP